MYFKKNSDPYEKFENFANLTNTVDLSDREPSLGIGETQKLADLFRSCHENFSTNPCAGSLILILRNEVPRSDDPRGANLNYLSNNIVNILSSNIKSLDTDYISPLGSVYLCEREEFDELLLWANEMREKTINSEGLVVVFPGKLLQCQTIHNKNREPKEYEFWIWVEGNAVGKINCSKLSRVRNPQCTAELYIDGGDVRFSAGPVPAANVSQLAASLHELYSEAISRHSEETSKINQSGYFNAQLEIAENAETHELY